MSTEFPFIVGIGASAGGVSALSHFFANVPRRSGMAFVIVTHLNPNRESQLHTVLSRQTEMPVKIAQDDELVEADTVYVMPERATLQIKDGRLLLNVLELDARAHKPIDIFFGSLAEDQKENAAAIVLSGGDGDGTIGVKIIKEHGGVTFAQTANGDPPLNPEMPESAIAAGFVDFAIPASAMPEKLVEIRGGRAELDKLINKNDTKDDPGSRKMQTTISELLKNYSGHDFSGYKSKTFFRRVARRMNVRHVGDLEGYCTLLEKDREEMHALFRDLLIGVTAFFRDPNAFDALEEQIIPKLFENKNARNPVRIWVPACTTGEEVYSLAILMCEHIEKTDQSVPIQIFATDIDEPALSIARQGRYPEQLVRSVNPERIKKYFRREGASYVIATKVREMCVFSPHNVISDPPFSRMDMVSCRNLLIYFGPDLQREVIPTFHYALKPGGYLFLGTSESISQFSDLFNTVDKKLRIFEAVEQTNRAWKPSSVLQKMSGRDAATRQEADTNGIKLRHKIERHILENHSPPHAVVREDGEIVFVSSGTGGLLEMPRGAPSNHLLDMVPREARVEIRAALRQVVDTRRATQRYNLSATTSSGPSRHFNLKIEPLQGSHESERLFIVFFQPIAPNDVEGAVPSDGVFSNDASDSEIVEIRERLQSSIEEYETALEELKSSNEELVSVNEEAQSTNEELEASKEELQSLNEELNTINAELNVKIEELDMANSDLRNLFEATQIATVFLDADLVIRNFTPAAGELFNLRSADLGRPLTELASVSEYPNLKPHIQQVFETGLVFEHRLSRTDTRTEYLVRITPYRATNEGVEGAVVTLIDVTSLAKAEEHQNVLIAELNHRVRNMLAVIIAIVKNSLRAKGMQGAAVDDLINRLQGMARAYDLLYEGSWCKLGLKSIVKQELASFRSDSVNISGPNVELLPTQILALSMVIHELATNAAKYGALAKPDGIVTVNWSVMKGKIVLSWIERDGPVADNPDPSGFGYALIKGQVEQQLEGKLETTFSPEGLSVRLEFPV